jgi:5-methylcytosine-specific restriction endonuclease McrA
MSERTCGVEGCVKPHRARGLCSTHYNQQHQPRRHAKQMVECVICGASIERVVSAARRPTCSVPCRSVLSGHDGSRGGYEWATDAMERARKAGAVTIERVERLAILERDAWFCYLCGRQCEPTASPFDPASATVDHVIALSAGGQHVLANLRTACLACNSSKRERTHAA